MKHFILFLLLFVSTAVVQAKDAPQGQQRSGALIARGVAPSRVQHAPANVDILLIIGEDEVTIRFNGDFGTGTYQLTDVNSGYTASNIVDAYAGSTEVIPFVVDETTSFEFTIEFEDGSWGQLSSI